MCAMAAATPQPELEQQYNNLTPPQQAIVEAYARYPNATNRDIAREHAPEIMHSEFDDLPERYADKDELNESYVSQTKNKDKIQRLIDWKREIKENQRTEGTMTTEGDPFTGIPEENTVQHIQDRPVSPNQDTETNGAENTHEPAAQQQVQIQQRDNGLVVWFDERYLQELLESQQLPPELQQRLVDAVLNRAFD